MQDVPIRAVEDFQELAGNTNTGKGHKMCLGVRPGETVGALPHGMLKHEAMAMQKIALWSRNTAFCKQSLVDKVEVRPFTQEFGNVNKPLKETIPPQKNLSKVLGLNSMELGPSFSICVSLLIREPISAHSTFVNTTFPVSFDFE